MLLKRQLITIPADIRFPFLTQCHFVKSKPILKKRQAFYVGKIKDELEKCMFHQGDYLSL